MARYAPTDDEVNNAQSVLSRAYQGWVSDLVEELLYECYVEELDESDLQDRVSERTDSGLIYTHDQWTALYASKNTHEAWDEMRDMDSTNTDNPVGVWAVLTYQQDVNSELWDSGLVKPVQEGMSLEERVNWLIEEHGGKEYPLGPDAHAWIVGEIENVNFGILVVTGDNHEHEFIGRHLDAEALRVLMDVILRSGAADSPAAKDFLRQASRRS